ncbi:hypothetical protein [Photobacterium profundum]|nr:hypothetical protein [Photobacterium profundum]
MSIIRIRKNAAKKIANLIEEATAFTLETHSTDQTDCMNSNRLHELKQIA